MNPRKKNKVIKEILDVIEQNKITRVVHIFAYYGGISRELFYKDNLHKVNTIKEALEKNRLKACSFLHNKWIKSDNPTLQIAVYKLLCDDEDRQRLTQSDITTNGKDLNQGFKIEIIDNKSQVRNENDTND